MWPTRMWWSRADPFHRTTEMPSTKLVPFTVRVKAPSPANLLVGSMLVVVGYGCGIDGERLGVRLRTRH